MICLERWPVASPTVKTKIFEGFAYVIDVRLRTPNSQRFECVGALRICPKVTILCVRSLHPEDLFLRPSFAWIFEIWQLRFLNRISSRRTSQFAQLGVIVLLKGFLLGWEREKGCLLAVSTLTASKHAH